MNPRLRWSIRCFFRIRPARASGLAALDWSQSPCQELTCHFGAGTWDFHKKNTGARRDVGFKRLSMKTCCATPLVSIQLDTWEYPPIFSGGVPGGTFFSFVCLATRISLKDTFCNHSKQAFSPKIRGSHHLQGNIQVFFMQGSLNFHGKGGKGLLFGFGRGFFGLSLQFGGMES